MLSSDPSHDATVRQLLQRGTDLNNDGRFDAARGLFQQALAAAQRAFGLDHATSQEALNAVALCDYNRCDYPAALESYRTLQASLLRTCSGDDPLLRITADNVQRCQLQQKTPTSSTVAEIVFRSYFPDELAYATFAATRRIRLERGTRLDPDGSCLIVVDPDPDYPALVEHMPGGVDQPGCSLPWTLQVHWQRADGTRVMEYRFVDGSVRRLDF